MSQFQSVAAVLGNGTLVSIGGQTGVAGTEVFVVIGEAKDVKFGGRKTSTVNNTTFASGNVQQKLGTLTDIGTMTVMMNRASNDAAQVATSLAQLTGKAYDFQVQLPIQPLLGQTVKGDLINLSGIVTEFGGFEVSLDKLAEISLTVDLNSFSVTVGS